MGFFWPCWDDCWDVEATDEAQAGLVTKTILILDHCKKLYYSTSKTRLGCGTKSMLTYPAADIVKLYEIISNDALILRQKAD